MRMKCHFSFGSRAQKILKVSSHDPQDVREGTSTLDRHWSSLYAVPSMKYISKNYFLRNTVFHQKSQFDNIQEKEKKHIKKIESIIQGIN